MLDQALFILANAIAGPAWLLNMAAPRAAITQRLAASQAAPVTIAALYGVALVASIGAGASGSFFTLEGGDSALRDPRSGAGGLDSLPVV